MHHQPAAALIVLAGGSGSRMTAQDDKAAGNNAERNKVYLKLGDRDIVEYSLITADRCPLVNTVVLVIRRGDERHATDLLQRINMTDTVRVTYGGATRQESEHAGLRALRSEILDSCFDVVGIHDGARPFMSPELLRRTIEVAHATGGAIPGLAVDENLYRTESSMIRALPTADLRRVQTPQSFRAMPLLDAYDRAAAAGFGGVDTAETIERFTNLEVRIVPGDDTNIKVTFADDLKVAERLADAWNHNL